MPRASKVDVEEDRSAIIAEMILRAEQAMEPGSMNAMQVIHNTEEGEGAPDLPMIVNSLQSAGYVYIYDTQTGERSVTNRNMLPSQLRKTRDDGSLVFTTIRPKKVAKRGSFPCYLHTSSPRRALFDTLGLATCRKATLTSDYEVQNHMKARHKREWGILQKMEADAERDEERKWRRLMSEGLMGVMGVTDTSDPQSVGTVSSCPVCGKEFTGASAKQIANKIRLHKRSHGGT